MPSDHDDIKRWENAHGDGFKDGDVVSSSENQAAWDMLMTGQMKEEMMKNKRMITLKPEIFEKDGNIDFVTDSNQLNVKTSELSDEKFVLLNKEKYPLKMTPEIQQEFDEFLEDPNKRISFIIWDLYLDENELKNIYDSEEYIKRTVYMKNAKEGMDINNITSIKPTGIFFFGVQSTTVYVVKTISDPQPGFNDIKGMTEDRKNKIIDKEKSNVTLLKESIDKLKSQGPDVTENDKNELMKLNKQANEMYNTLKPQPTEPSGGSILKKKKRKVHRSRKLSKTKKSKTSKRKMAKKSRKASKKGRKTRRK
jgi:hypothetical protein